MGMLNTSSAIRVNYDYERKRWFVDTPIAMPLHQLQKVLRNSHAQLSIRVKGEIGDKRKRMQEALDRMFPEYTDQYLIGSLGERTLYQTPEKTKLKTFIKL